MPKLSSKLLGVINKRAAKATVAPWFSVRNDESSDTAEILIYSQIGKDWYSDDGIGAKDFNDALKAIPANKQILVRINSPGGNVWDGLAIYNMLNMRGDKVLCRVEGLAASIASVIAMAGKCEMPRNSLMMIHEPSSILDFYTSANPDEMREIADEIGELADMLDKHGDVIASVYATKCGESAKVMRGKMRDTTWMTGAEANECGLCDVVTEEIQLAACGIDPSLLKNLAVRNAATANPKDKEPTMDKTKIIAALKARGVTADEKLTSDQLLDQLLALPAPAAAAQTTATAPDETVANLAAEMKALREEKAKEQKARITATVKDLQPNRFPVAQVEAWINRAMQDETVLDALAAIPTQVVGAEPVGQVELTGESVQDISKFVVANTTGLTSKFIGANAGRAIGKQEVNDIAAGARKAHAVIKQHRDMLVDAVMNANTIDTNLKRNVILNTTMLEEFSIPLLALRQFSTVFENVPLEGTDKIEVPYMGLQGIGESKSFSYATGYTFTGNTAIGTREITVGGDGDAATCGENATAGTVKDRLYQDVTFTSWEKSRQPFFLIDKLFGSKAARLGVDGFAAIVRRCIVSGNYGTALTRSASAFTSDDLAYLWEVATGLNWPSSGRQVTLHHPYNTSLIKDPAFKAVYAAGNDEALRRAEIKKAYGFDDINIVANLDTYFAANSNITGWIAHMCALLVATAVIVPTEEVRKLLTRFDVATDPKTGISMAYRRWGNAEGDASREIVEYSIGAAPGLASAMKLIKKQ